jgi:hypothetical protein
MSLLGVPFAELRQSLKRACAVDNESSHFPYSDKPRLAVPSANNKLLHCSVVSAIHFIPDDRKMGLRRR